jgi:MFS family permease
LLAVHRLKKQDDIVLIPQPSDDVNDPLNWSRWKKIGAFSPLIIFAFLGNWVTAGLGVALLILVNDFQVSLNAAADGFIAYCVLGLGVGVLLPQSFSINIIQNFLWVPTALYIGKRPTFLLAASLFFAAIIWSAKAQTYRSLVAARVISGIAAACSEGLASAINADLFFLHERGLWMGIYILFLNLGPTLGSLISGFVVQSLGWRWHFWVRIIHPKL